MGCFSRCNTNRSAVLLPIPGKRATSLTAFSRSFDEKSMTVKLRIINDEFIKKRKDNSAINLFSLSIIFYYLNSKKHIFVFTNSLIVICKNEATTYIVFNCWIF